MLDGDHGEKQAIIDENIGLDSPDCLVKLREATSDKQVFVMDVTPGQSVTFWGSGFIADQAQLSVKYVACDLDDQGADPRMLVPRLDPVHPESSYRYCRTLTKAIWDVRGSDHEPGADDTARSWTSDFCVVDWPVEAADEGLYKLTLKFKNEKGYYTRLRAVDCESCAIEGDKPDYVETQPLYFVVLPPVNLRAVR